MPEFTQTFSNAFRDVMSQFGMNDVKIVDNKHVIDLNKAPDVNIEIKLTGDVHGDVVYSMNVKLAKAIASAMMGMGVEDFDDIAKSAVCELSNMLAANSCTLLASNGFTSDISTPQILSVNDINGLINFNCVELKTDELPFFIFLSLTA